MNETIEFRINFTATYYKSPPGIIITIDDDVKFTGKISNNKQLVKFNHTLNFSDPHKLQINRKFAEADQMLVIDSIFIDHVDVKNIIWEYSYFEPEYPEPWATEQHQQGHVLEPKVIGETWLGHNGIWTLNFSSPFYRYLMLAMNQDL